MAKSRSSERNDVPGSTRHVALATLPRRLRSRGSPHSPNVTAYREFQDREVVPGTRYQIIRLIGAGGMGRVYEVEHVELGKRFVLKSLQRELARREDLVARLRNEWRALARLEHPNIVNVTDAGTSLNGVPYYVMERLEGETLSMRLHRQRRLLPQQALAITAGILEGLHAAHQIGVVHRDVKPPNIFLTGPTTVKVLDFGIAKIKDAKDVITARGIAVGTPRYMSPEQARGSAVDARSDIYATGLMLFEMISGVGPFDDAKNHTELLVAHLGRPAPLLSSATVVAPELDALVAAMLAKDPRERPHDARQAAETLRGLVGRYARYAGTETPTVNASLPRRSSSELPTRLEGPRRAPQPAPQPGATRPGGADDATTQQPAFEIATTAAHALPLAGPHGTQRLLPSAQAGALAPATLYGADTLRDPLTRAPSSAPGVADARTERLLTLPILPVIPGQQSSAQPGPTHTSVPLGEPPNNVTPPPVVPGYSQPPPATASSSKLLLVGALSLGALALGGGGLLLLGLRSGSGPAAAYAPPVSPSVGEAAAVPSAAAVVSSSPPAPATLPVALPAPAAASVAPRVAPVTAQNPKKKSHGSVFLRPAARAPVPAIVTPPAPSPPGPAPVPPPARGSQAAVMPGSGL